MADTTRANLTPELSAEHVHEDGDWLEPLTALCDEALLILDGAGRVTRATGRLDTLFGCPPSGLEGRDFRRLLCLTDLAQFDGLMAEDSGPAIIDRQVRLRLPDGTYRPVRMKARNALSGMDGAGMTGLDGAILVALRDIAPEVQVAASLADHEALLRGILDTMMEGMLQLDGDGHIQDLNPAAETIFASTRQALLHQPIHLLIDADSHGALDTAMGEAMAGAGGETVGRRCRVRGRRCSKGTFPLTLGISGFWRGGNPVLVLTARDDTEEAEAEAALKRSEERFALASEAANDGLWDWWTTRPNVYFGHRFEALLGFAAKPIEAGMEHWFSRVHTDDLPRLETALDLVLSGEARTLEAEIRMRHADGVFRWFLARGLGIKGQDGRLERVVGAITDITGRKHAEERAAFMALHDGLTGLPNRQLMLDRLEQTIQRRDRAPDQPFALLVIDLDRFRIVNESLGHHVGDQLLVRLAERLQGVVHRADTVARLGADQFAVLIDDLDDPGGGVSRGEAMRALIARSIGAPGIDGIRLDSSIGVRVWRAESVRGTDLLRDATLAMQEAKRRGGDRVVEFFGELKTHVLRAYRYESELRTAIQNGGIEAFYQPIIDIASGMPSGFEALARLRLPSGELASPADFIPVAEETGLIADLARLVVEQSVDQLSAWQVRFPRLHGLTVAVNLSPKQFERQDVVTDIRKAAARAGIACDGLKVEITEGVLMQNPTSAATILSDLKSLGVQVGIDDFGTGYSSLSYLREFDFDFLKIDQSFTRRLLSTKRDQELVRTIVQLGQNVGMTVVAEGVERADQLTLLGQLGCHRAQGFLFARPLPAADATAWLARHTVAK